MGFLRSLLYLVTKVVLSFPYSSFAEVDGILGAVVVAGHAVGAMAHPLGMAVLHRYVMQRTSFGAEATIYTPICGMEFTVGDKNGIEERVDNSAHQSWQGSTHNIHYPTPLFNLLGHLRQTGTYGINLLGFGIGVVETEAWQVDIGLWHHKSECCIKVQPNSFHVGRKPLWGTPQAVAACTCQVAVFGNDVKCQLA